MVDHETLRWPDAVISRAIRDVHGLPTGDAPSIENVRRLVVTLMGDERDQETLCGLYMNRAHELVTGGTGTDLLPADDGTGGP